MDQNVEFLCIKALSEVPTFPPGGKHSQKMHFLCIKAPCEVPTLPPGGTHSQKMHFLCIKAPCEVPGPVLGPRELRSHAYSDKICVFGTRDGSHRSLEFAT